jgi:hypothetical protein
MKNKITETPQLSLWAWRIIVNEFEKKREELEDSLTYYENASDEDGIKMTTKKTREIDMILDELYGYNPEEA